MILEEDGSAQVRTTILTNKSIADYNKYYIDEMPTIINIPVPNIDSFLNEDLKKER